MTHEPTAAPTAEPADGDDPYLWLEDVTGDEALDWVRERNAAAFDELAGGPRYAELRDGIREILDADDRIPYVSRYDDHLFNFWRDAEHPRGLWRRTTLDSYRTAEPDWDVLLDLDALAAADGENWVWHGASGLFPDYRRWLIHLSRGGADADVVREWDIDSRAFVPGGFEVPEAKTRIRWIDEDTVYVGTDEGPGSMTESGYPRLARRWRRGTALADADIAFEGEHTDISAGAYRDPTVGFERHFAYRRPTFYSSREYVLGADGAYRLIDVPEDADTDVHREWLLIRPRSAWTVAGVEHPAGSLLAARFDDFLAGDRTLTAVFTPDGHTSLSRWWWTRHHLVVATLADVKTVLAIHSPDDGWAVRPLPGVPEFGDAYLVDTDPQNSDEYWLASESFTEPPTLRRGVIEAGSEAEPETLRRSPARYDADGVVVHQYFATSADGTRVPYFVVGRPSAGPVPVLISAYGGFEVSETPGYIASTGYGWIERGGTYVLANIRGGGEYGPAWHQAALRENRPRAYEDCAAVARDLVARGITTAGQLGLRGGSNGGLLAGNMLVGYPELFGAIVCEVPLLDMRRYHLLLAGASWMAEWGDPDDPADWAYLQTYSPYHLVRPGREYPPILITTSTRDDRVHPGHARKMVARMSEFGLDVRYYENIEGGHGGAADNSQAAVKSALVLEFLWQRLGK